MRGEAEIPGLVGHDRPRRQLRRQPVVDLLALEPREHPVRGRRRHELPLREEREVLADHPGGRGVVVVVVIGDVEVREAERPQRRVDVVRAERVPQRERRPVVGDRDHRLERFVDGHDRPGDLVRAVVGDVLRLDLDRVRVPKRAGVDETLDVGQDPELVQRGGDEHDVRIVRIQGLGRERIGDEDAGVARERLHQAIHLDDQIGGRGSGTLAERSNEHADRDRLRDSPHQQPVTPSGPECFTDAGR